MIHFSAEALAEAKQAARWYRTHGSVNTSSEFSAEVQRVARLIDSQPELGSPGVRSTRRMHLRQFPFTLVYRIHSDEIRIIAVAHQSRSPLYWAGRH